MEIIKLILLLAGFILFIAGAFSAPARFNIVSAGLACWILVPLITAVQGLD